MVSKHILHIAIFYTTVVFIKTARILVFIPTASISHQVVIRPLTQELAKRGHEVVVITTDPAFRKETAPENLKEVNVHNAAYATMNFGLAAKATGKKSDIHTQMTSVSKIIYDIFDAEINTNEVQELIKDKNQRFDLLILEACVSPALIFTHIFKAPTILFSTLPTYDAINEITGAVTHPLLYPTLLHQKLYNLTTWEKLQELNRHYSHKNLLERQLVEMGDKMLRKNFGDDIPALEELRKNVDMVFLAEHSLWDNNRPVPPGVVYVGGIYPNAPTAVKLPADLKTFLDSSKNGVIYMSFGTNVNISSLPEGTIYIFLKSFSKLSYDIVLKWDDPEFPEVSKNIKIFKWLPQAALLHHPNIKLFMTQGGLQSIDDAINAGVPLIGMPMLLDQWYNVEQCVRHKIGLKLEIESITEEKMLTAIKTVIEDESYQANMVALRAVLYDQSQTALDRAVWWTEYVITNKGAMHLRGPAALITNWDYFELDLVLFIASFITIMIAIITMIGYKLFVLLKHAH